MTELEQITSIINSKDYGSLPNSAKKELRMKQQVLIRKLIKDTLKQHIEPLLMTYDLDSDIRIYNDGEDGIKVDFVEYWSDVDMPKSKVAEDEKYEQWKRKVEEEHLDAYPFDALEPLKDIDHSNIKPFIQHKLDWSQFLYGMTVDTKYHQAIFDLIGKKLDKGETFPFKLLLDDKVFDAIFECPNIKARKDYVIRLMYKGKKDSPGTLLQTKFPKIYGYIKRLKEENGGRFQVKLPENLQVMLNISETDTPFVYRMTYKANK